MKPRFSYESAVPGAIFILSALFFGLYYPSHIRFQEQFQLFEFTWEYFAATISIPGGFSLWCGRFLAQFFRCPLLGATIVAGLITCAQILTRKVIERNGDTTAATSAILSIIPAVFMFAMFMSDHYLPGAAVAILINIACAFVIKECVHGALRFILIPVLIIVIYALSGPACFIFVLLLPRNAGKVMMTAAPLALPLVIFCSSSIIHYSFKDLCLGEVFCRIPDEIPTAFWLCALSIIAVYHISPAVKKVTLALLLAAASFLILIPFGPDMRREHIMSYESLVSDEDWEGILRLARKSPPDNNVTISYVNLALAMQGKLGELQFSYPQSGEKGLFPSYGIHYESLLGTSEIYWHIGLVNICQQYVFDAQESIPDMQKSARCYKRLAETNIINGDYKVAEKYLSALGNTLFYARWAKDARELIAGGESAIEHTLYGRKRSTSIADRSVLFNENNKYVACRMLCERDPENRVAEQYLYSLLLLENDHGGFYKRIMSEDKMPSLPKSYREALLLICIEENQPLDSFKGLVTDADISRMKSFIADMKARKSETAMKKKYGDTYWYYSLHNE